MVKTIWVNKITGEAYGENKREAIENILFSMSEDEKKALIEKESSLDDVLKHSRYGTIYINDIIMSLIVKLYLETKEVKIKSKWVDDETGEEFFSEEELYRAIQENYFDDKDFICELIDENYTPSEVYEATKEKGVEGFEEEVKKKLQEVVIERWFTYIEVEDE